MEQRNMRELLEKYKYYVIGAAVVLVVIIALVAGGRKTETVPEEPQETQEATDSRQQISRSRKKNRMSWKKTVIHQLNVW